MLRPSAWSVVWEIRKRWNNDVVDGKQKQTSLSRSRKRKGSFEWQVQLQSPPRWFSWQEAFTVDVNWFTTHSTSSLKYHLLAKHAADADPHPQPKADDAGLYSHESIKNFKDIHLEQMKNVRLFATRCINRLTAQRKTQLYHLIQWFWWNWIVKKQFSAFACVYLQLPCLTCWWFTQFPCGQIALLVAKVTSNCCTLLLWLAG